MTSIRLALRGSDIWKICRMAAKRLPCALPLGRKLTQKKIAAASPTTIPQDTRLREIAWCFSIEISKNSHTLATLATCSTSWEKAGAKVFFNP